jgi:hypothetical protein
MNKGVGKMDRKDPLYTVKWFMLRFNAAISVVEKNGLQQEYEETLAKMKAMVVAGGGGSMWKDV